MAQNDSEWPISPDSQLFQCFPAKVTHNDSEWPISPDSQLFQSFPTKAAQNDSEWPILHGQNKIHSDTREFPRKTTLLHGQLCPKPYGFLVDPKARNCYTTETLISNMQRMYASVNQTVVQNATFSIHFADFFKRKNIQRKWHREHI